MARKVSRDCEPARRMDVFLPSLKKRKVGIDMMRYSELSSLSSSRV